jgi:hypothetical protein
VPRPPGLIGATLDDNLSPISKPNTNNLGQIPNDEQNLHRPRSQKSSTPPVNPRRKVMHHRSPPEAYEAPLLVPRIAWASVPE